MKYWHKSRCNPKKLILEDGYLDRVLSVTVMPDGDIRFREECDEYYSLEVSKVAALALIDELRRWIEDEGDKQ